MVFLFTCNERKEAKDMQRILHETNLFRQHIVQAAPHTLYGIPLKGAKRMLTSNQLAEMGRTEIEQVNKSGLVDITSVKIDTSLPPAQRMQNYLEQIKNPYCFLCGKTPVQISFKPDGKELDGLLGSYFLGLKSG
jgi:hypothetical protein